MKIIGHRGAAGLALENSAASLSAALAHKIDAIELDVRLTADGRLALLHDESTWRVAKENVRVADVTMAKLSKVVLLNGQHVPSLDQALDQIKDCPVIIDAKDHGCSEELARVIKRHPKARISVTSFNHDVIEKLTVLSPSVTLYVSEHFSPFDIVKKARRAGAHGFTLNMWLMNPLTYMLAQRYKLQMLVYTVNSPFIVRFYQRLYPKALIVTDFPDRFVGKRRQKRLSI